jgi:antitoxin ParD1/3/4
MMRRLVESGEYASTSEVVREALRDWKFRRAQREKAIEGIGRAWDTGIESGPATDGEEAFARLHKRLGGREAL